MEPAGATGGGSSPLEGSSANRLRVHVRGCQPRLPVRGEHLQRGRRPAPRDPVETGAITGARPAATTQNETACRAFSELARSFL